VILDRTEREGTGASFPRISSGNVDVDEVLGGGFPSNSINILMGLPGTGKTILVEQLVFHNATGDRPVLYLTTLGEPLSKVVSYAQRMAFFDPARIGSGVLYDDIGPALVADGARALVQRIGEEIRTSHPCIVVIDSFRAIHDIGASAAELRRATSELAGLLSAYDITTFLLGEYTRDEISQYPEFAIADSIVELARNPLGTRDERFLHVLKLRGSGYRDGQHAFRITDHGIELYPRLISPTLPDDYEAALERVPSGVAGLDAVLGGGLWRGSTTLLIGPTGSGKTTVGLQFAMHGVEHGEPTLVVNFQENPVQLRRAARSLGFELGSERRADLHTLYFSPVELRIDSIVGSIFQYIRRQGIRRLVVDAVGDLAGAANDAQRVQQYLYALVQHFAVNNVTTLLMLESVSSTTAIAAQERLSYMSDNVVELGHHANGGAARTLRIIKTRNSEHDGRLHTLAIDGRGAQVRPADTGRE
jgi:circadian clock protein KaiC